MEGCVAYEYVEARGHAYVMATHRSTFEVTVEPGLTPRGDCIVGVAASKAPSSFSEGYRRIASRDESIILAVLCAPGGCDVVVGRGSQRLVLSDERRMVFRRSSYVGPETVMIGASKAARDLDRRLIGSLRSPEARLQLVLIALDPTCMSTTYM
jgi:hypothetical protein